MRWKVPQILLRRFRMEDGLILTGLDDDLGDKFIWQQKLQQHQAHLGHQGEGEEIEKQRGMEIERRQGLKLKVTRDEVGNED
jgi:hypothetical protein